MILTPEFVFLQMPRTGSTFCEEVIMGIVPGAKRYLNPPGRSKHNYREDIPDGFRSLPVAGVRRDPLELLDSWGCMGIWQTLHIDIPQEGVNRRIGFEEWHTMAKKQFNVDTGLIKAVYAAMFEPIDDVTFLDFANLNHSLYNFLKGHGYDNEGILGRRPTNVNGKKFRAIPSSMMDEVVRAEA